MTSVDNIAREEVSRLPGEDILRAQLSGGTSTYVSRLSRVRSFTFSVEGTNTTTATRSGKTITFTGTGSDWVNVRIIGDP